MDENRSLVDETPKNRPDVERIMSDIREKVRRDLAESADRAADYRPHQARSEEDGAVPVLYSEELNYLNANWGNWYAPVPLSSHRRLVGKFVVKIKAKLRDWTWNYLLRDYIERERQYQMNLVRFLNSTAKYIDARDTHIFWELIRKVDFDIQGLNERANRLYDEAMGTARSLEIEMAKTGAVHADQSAAQEHERSRIHAVEDLVRGLERTVSLLAKACAPQSPAAPSEGPPPRLGNESGTELLGEGVDYLLLENRYRGSEEVIKDRLSQYLQIFEHCERPIVELGCGRGEFLELLKDRGKSAVGLDIDEAMVQRCREKGLTVERGDALDYLERCEDGSVGAVFAAQLVEHLSREQLDRLLSLAAKKIAPGGVVVFETINPQSVTALCRNFFRDPTHIWPLHPDTLQFMLEMKGIRTEDVIYSSAFPAEAVLRPIADAPELPPRWRSTIQSINDNSQRLNDLLFGFQDYAIVGRIEER